MSDCLISVLVLLVVLLVVYCAGQKDGFTAVAPYHSPAGAPGAPLATSPQSHTDHPDGLEYLPPPRPVIGVDAGEDSWTGWSDGSKTREPMAAALGRAGELAARVGDVPDFRTTPSEKPYLPSSFGPGDDAEGAFREMVGVYGDAAEYKARGWLGPEGWAGAPFELRGNTASSLRHVIERRA